MIELARAKHPDLKFVVHDLMDGPWDVDTTTWSRRMSPSM
jgi:hypothetical protein